MPELKLTRLELPNLPYGYNALEPVISKKIMELHHSRHHLSYVTGANAAMDKLERYRVEERETDIKAVLRDYSFNLNGHLLHNIFWNNMRPPKEGNRPSPAVLAKLETYFGSFEVFQKEFSDAAKAVEGSGWAELVMGDDGDLQVIQVEKHNLLHIVGYKPILVLDVWEHAYYLDYQNNRADYVDKWWDVVNWDDVEKRLS